MSDSGLDQTPADVLHRQVQEFINAVNAINAPGEDPELLDVAVVVFEVVSYDADGDPHREVKYVATARNAGLASTAGLLDIGREVLSGDMFDGDDD